jgi:Tfp pilus assembly protein PilO
MDKDKLIKELLQKSQNYSQQLYLVAFFIVFVILILFFVRPTVNEYVLRNKELEETVALSEQYQQVINNMTQLQSLLESERDNFILLDQAIPNNIHMYQLTQDVRSSFLRFVPTRTYSFPAYTVSNLSTNEGKGKAELKEYKLLVNVSGTYSDLQGIMGKIFNQRRIKSIKSLRLSRPEGASDSANLEMKLEVGAYHL